MILVDVRLDLDDGQDVMVSTVFRGEFNPIIFSRVGFVTAVRGLSIELNSVWKPRPLGEGPFPGKKGVLVGFYGPESLC